MGDEKEHYDGLHKPHVSAPTPHPPAPKRRTPLNNIKTTHMQRSAPTGRHYPPPPQCGNPPKNPETNTTRPPRVGSVGAVSINKDKRPETPKPQKVPIYIYIYIYIYVHMCMCVYIFIYIYLSIYILYQDLEQEPVEPLHDLKSMKSDLKSDQGVGDAETPAGGQGRFRHPLLQGPTAFHESSGQKSGI